MVLRTLFTSSSTPPVTGKNLLDNLAEKIGILFNAMALIPTSISNVGNDYTIIIDPVLDSDVGSGMLFWVTPEQNNTGPARLRVTSSNPYYDWVKLDGEAFAADEVEAGSTYGVLFVNGEFRTVTTAAASGAGANIDYQEFTSSGTWTKPDDTSPNALVFVEAWGGGGGGGHSSSTAAGGGGGGGYNWKACLASDLGLTVTVTVGAGGNAGSTSGGGTGGNTSFGTFVLAFGGGGGVGGATNSAGGGGGGGQISAGANGSAANGGAGGNPFSGAAGATANTGGGGGGSQPGGDGLFGGGGGGGGGASTNTGGRSFYGGGGGGADTDAGDASGGTSSMGGNGGNGQSVATAGSIPGGGGGASSGTSAGAGARGEVHVWTIG